METYESFYVVDGARCIAKELNELGFPCTTNYIADIMKSRYIKARNGKGFNCCHQSLTMVNVRDNLLWRNFKVKLPNEKWTTDITYIWVENKWLYLETVMDLFSRKIVGWALGNSMTEELVRAALKVAILKRKVAPGLILNSEGCPVQVTEIHRLCTFKRVTSEYESQRQLLGEFTDGIHFSRFKAELIYARNYQAVEEVRSDIFKYVEILYNRKRRHSSIEILSPAAYEEWAALAA